jgi:hypothetical protein
MRSNAQEKSDKSIGGKAGMPMILMGSSSDLADLNENFGVIRSLPILCTAYSGVLGVLYRL